MNSTCNNISCTMRIKVFIADDHPVVLEGIQKVLADCVGITVTGAFSNGHELLQGLKAKLPDVLLLDIQMPGKQGDELAQKISHDYPVISIIALTNLDQSFHVQNMFKNGAQGYLLKSAGKDKIIQAIEAVSNGEQYIDAAMREQMVQEMIESNIRSKATPALTEREKEVLQLIVDELTSLEIAGKLFLSQRTVEHHRDNLLLKLDVKNTAGLVKKAIKFGLVK